MQRWSLPRLSEPLTASLPHIKPRVVSDTQSLWALVRARLRTDAPFCEVVVLKLDRHSSQFQNTCSVAGEEIAEVKPSQIERAVDRLFPAHHFQRHRHFSLHLIERPEIQSKDGTRLLLATGPVALPLVRQLLPTAVPRS